MKNILTFLLCCFDKETEKTFLRLRMRMPARLENVRDDFHATGILFGRIAQRQTKDNMHFVIRARFRFLF